MGLVKMMKYKTIFLKMIADFNRDVTALGGATFYFFVVLFLLVFGEYSLVLHLLFGFVISFLLIVVIRILYFKHRPAKQSYANILEKIDASSFPSWHALRVVFLGFSAALYVSDVWAKGLLLVIMLLAVYSRMYLRKHDLVDVLVGSVLGWGLFGVSKWLFLF